MRLVHLDQRILLHWGEAQLLAYAIEWVLCYHLELEQPQRTTAAMALCFGPLQRVRGRLRGRALAEQYHAGPPPRKSWKLTLRYEEVVALMHILPTAPTAGQAWGAIQQASLSLERYIDFTRH